MSTSRKRLLWAFSAATALLTLVLLVVEEKRTPPMRPRPPGLATPLPEDSETLRIGFFSVGPNDVEPRLVDEVILGLDTPVRVDLSHRSTRARYENGTGWSVGVHAPGLLSWPVEWTLEEDEDPFHLEAQLEEDEDGRRMIHCSLDAMFAGGGTKGAMIRMEAGPAVRVFVDSVGWESEDDWRTDFVLARTEGKTTGHWDVERWRAAIIEGLSQRDRYGPDRNAAALIPCPAAREELGDGLERAELTARLLAGDARATANADDMTVSLLRSGLRTLWLKYPDMRPFARGHLIASHGEYFAGPQLAPRFAEDAELAAAMAPPARGRWKRIGPTVLFVLIALAFALPMLLARSPNPDRAAAWAVAGCVLTMMQIKVEGFNLPGFVTIPLLCGAAFGLCAAARASTLSARVGRALAFGLIPCQVWILLGAPSLVGQVGSVACAVLPFALLAATDPLVHADARARTDRSLWWYAFTNLLLPVSFLLVDLVDQALGRDMVGSSFQGWLALLVLLASVVGLILAAVRFGRLRGPLRELRPAVGPWSA